MASVTITSSALSPSVLTIQCSSISYALKKNNTAEPIENGTNLAYVQTQSFNNPIITLNNVVVTNVSGTFDMSHALTLMGLKYDGSNQVLLDIDYGIKGATQGLPRWTSSGITSTAIPVVLESANFSIDAQDSKEGYMPTGTLVFVHTR